MYMSDEHAYSVNYNMPVAVVETVVWLLAVSLRVLVSLSRASESLSADNSWDSSSLTAES